MENLEWVYSTSVENDAYMYSMWNLNDDCKQQLCAWSL